MLDGYWISPKGRVYDIPITHIDFIVKNPKLFGYTIEELKDIANKYNEYLTDEGKARNEIMTNALKQGWIRIRYDKQREWIVQIWTMTKKVKDNLFSWVHSMLQGTIKNSKKVFRNTQIYLMELKLNNSSLVISFDDILSGKLYEKLNKAVNEGKFEIDEEVDFELRSKAILLLNIMEGNNE